MAHRRMLAALLTLGCVSLGALATDLGGVGPAPSSAQAAGPRGRFVPVGPMRLTDTREGDCRCTRIDAQTTRIDIAGRSGLPAGIIAAAVTVTAANAVADGFVSVDADGVRSGTSTLNVRAGHVGANSTIVRLGAQGSIDIFTQVAMDVIVDLSGVFVASPGVAGAGRFINVAPARLVDTRARAGALAPGESVQVPLPSGVSADALAVVVNVTTTDALIPGFVRAGPRGAPPPPTSFINPDGGGRPQAASVIVPVSPSGLTVTTTSGGHLIVDLVGWFSGASAAPSTSGLYTPMAAARLLDTRAVAPRLFPSGTRELPIPIADAMAVITNVTMALPDGDGYVTAFAAGVERPPTSSLNAIGRDVIAANLAITAVSSRGTAYFSNRGADLVVDVLGYFSGAPIAAPLPPAVNAVPRPRVLLVGDSSLAALNVVRASQSALRGFVPLVDAEPCRRLTSPSCRSDFTGRVPNTAVDSINAAVGPLDMVVMRTGYNDGLSHFAGDVAAIIQAARQRGADTVVWLTYSEGTGGQLHRYAQFNAILRAMAADPAYPELVVADWRTYAASSSGWYAADRVHFLGVGAWATADYISRWVAHWMRTPCPVPWTPSTPIADRCDAPELEAARVGSTPALRALYGF